MPKSASYQERARLRLSRTPEFYRRFLAGFPGSGLSVAQYCRKHQVGESTFHKYLRKRKSDKGKVQSRVGTPRLVRLLPAPSSPETAHPFEIQLQNGTVFRLAHLDAQILAALGPILAGVTP